ncbi:hypothetical protein AALO_G00032100 [Alosa alosa]|uniref:Uncharacterized protein n=1 Tax=Alosa alosa TaxID=278164 RepID=A0AAV6HGB2_9TELE|nr:hypothetical protein AALO_G00032100 [Alosa alosa]
MAKTEGVVTGTAYYMANTEGVVTEVLRSDYTCDVSTKGTLLLQRCYCQPLYLPTLSLSRCTNLFM